jgi:two-component system chemotaxis response regulator CheB
VKPNLLILSTDSNIKNYLKTELTKQGFAINTDASSVFNLSKFIRSDKSNILILDSDTIVASPESLLNLTTSHDFHVILIGTKNVAPLLIAGIKGAFSKPDSKNSFAMRILLRNILDRIDLHMRNSTAAAQTPTMSIAAAADVGSRVIAIAASTGGTEALNTLLAGLPSHVPPILIVQHMPSVFTYQFAERLDKVAKFSVKEASMTDIVKKNQALIAPGGLHMKIVRRSKKLLVECFSGPKVHGVIPAADVLFDSMAEFMGKNVIGVVLTGMGSDGARGLLKLKKKGASVIAQDQASCVVYGMPKAAVDLGAVDYILPINKIADKISSLI